MIASIVQSLSKSFGDDDENVQEAGEPTGGEETTPAPPPRQHEERRGSLFRQDGQDEVRKDHLKNLILKEKIRNKRFNSIHAVALALTDKGDVEDSAFTAVDSVTVRELEKQVDEEDKGGATSKLQEMLTTLKSKGADMSAGAVKQFPLEVRVKDFSFTASVDASSAQIKTVYNSSGIYPIARFFKRLFKGERLFQHNVMEKKVLQNINLVFQPGKSYLVLGPPGSGKTTLLKAISGLFKPGAKDTLEGTISYNGRTLEAKENYHIENCFAYIDQLDKHAPRLTVDETFSFAYDCKKPETYLLDRPAPADRLLVEMILFGLGLDGVRDTYVGGTTVRGISGGQRRRVTVGEMLTSRASVLCGDEISTGLDASSTFDMIQILIYFAKLGSATRVISLLQPSPETVSLFDEVIVLAEGQIIYAGPVKGVENYFAEIGFVCPPFVDVADFLQMVTAEDSASLYDPTKSIKEQQATAPTVSELAKLFQESEYGKETLETLESPPAYVWHAEDSQQGTGQVSDISTSKNVTRKYANNFFVSTWLICKRFFILWTRDKRVIIAAAAKNVIMGLSVGGCYINTTNVIQIEGALFQAGLFIILGSMQSASSLVADRVIFYKHYDANFYSAWPFVFGRMMSQLPQITVDTIMFATILYFMVGLADKDDAVNFFVFLSLLWVFAILMGQQLAVFASFASEGTLSAISACIVLFLILFGGFIIAPATIPDYYYYWIYWWNPLAWTYRALVVNEFRSGRWDDPDEILTDSGMLDPYGNPFGSEWIGYAYAFGIPYSLICTTLTALGLSFIRNEGGTAVGEPEAAGSATDEEPKKLIEIPFKPVTLSFQDICYDVTASTSNETLRLLKNVSGIFRAGRMCALMGSSGAGKTTLMDVIALRKRSGTITGKVLLNGWPQEAVSFRRCSGYVEQFDVQSPELTVRETILFSAKLRLDPKLVSTSEETEAFVDQILEQSELAALRDSPVGTDEGLGLSFEQRKRLSIAVELAASPSVIFLDEPTSGLDARSALLVVQTLRKIADGGRTICATIHQPSSAVFGMFDDLLLLKKGGQVVFHGDLGKENCSDLVTYYESKGAEPIALGDNPANWMLRVMDSSGVGDLAEKYVQSDEYSALQKELEEIENTPNEDSKIEYDSEFAATSRLRRWAINNRLTTIYWRSPSYNYSRLLVSILVSFVLGSPFLTNRRPEEYTENDMRSRVSVIFLTFVISGIMAILTVLPVMTWIRDMFYRHRDAGFYDSGSIGMALGVAEKWFIVASSALFTTVFLATAGLLPNDEPRFYNVVRMIAFWGFFTFNFALYSYFGQLFVCLVKPMATAVILCSVFIGINNFFSGLVVRPQFMIGTFYVFLYYITPGMYVYNGLITALYADNNETVIADAGSEYSDYLISTGICSADETPCVGTASDYVYSFFGGYFGNRDTNLRNALVLGLFLVTARLGTWVCLKYIRFSD